jgi:prepilin-type N-terminal cleavage/methylation domain-containing protein
MKILTRKAFTLVELLIVIGIIGLLAVTVLLALNPAEAQRKSRDTKRIRDASTLQAVLEQMIDGGTVIATTANTLGGAGGVSSSGITGSSQNCASGQHWLGAYDLCPYVKTVPLDPQNNQTRTYQNGSAVAPTTTSGVMFYRAIVSGSNYEIGVRQESAANVSKLTGDGGEDADWFEVYSGANNLF